jgi:hypothetical protein
LNFDSETWEVDHGEEIEGEEKIRQKEEGRSGQQKEEDAQIQGEESHQESTGQKGRAKAQGRAAEAEAGSDGCAGSGTRARTGAVLDRADGAQR